MVVLPWIILLYLSITSAIECIAGVPEYGKSSVLKYLSNWTFCSAAFIVADFLFNKKKHTPFQLQELSSFTIALPVEAVYWISFVISAVVLREQDYSTYVRGGGAHFWQNVFQFSSFMVFYFAYKKQWIKIALSLVIMTYVMVFTPVRSLLFFIAMPLLVYYLYKYLFKAFKFKGFIIRFVPIVIAGMMLAGILSSIRFGMILLPETELTRISLDVIRYYAEGDSIPLHYFNSWQHFFSGLLSPVYSAFNLLGVHLQPDLDPSIPLVNASINRGQSDFLYVGEVGHNPGTIMHDFLFSFGSFAFLEAFIYYFFLVKLCDFIQKNAWSLMFFSSLFGWHIYMMMRGALDNACSGIGYSIWYAFIFYFIWMYFYRQKKRQGV